MTINAYRFVTGAAAGGVGVATATSPVKQIRGVIRSIDIAYIGSPPASTTDATVRTKGHSGQTATNILVVTNAATDGRFYPTHLLHDAAGAAEEDPTVGEGFPVDDGIDAVIAQANNDDSLIVTLNVEE